MDSSPKSNKARRPRPQKSQYSASAAPLHLSGLPRFHPATYGCSSSSNPSSLSTTPGGSTPSNASTPRHGNPPPLSPRTQQRMFEAQRQLSHYQQHLISQYASKDHNVSSMLVKPDSPKLSPTTASPGPVTPLELEERDGYLGGPGVASGSGIKREDLKLRGDNSPRRKM
jgi:hypothetical protein